MKTIINFILNNQSVSAEVDGDELLVDLLRETFNLTGTKIGCGEGECGACTVIMDGKTVNSCMILAASVAGRSILTIEGLAKEGELSPMQESFIEHGAVQCGFCTPGMVLSAEALVQENPNPTKEEIKKAIEGNLCRCTGYKKIIEAIEASVKK